MGVAHNAIRVWAFFVRVSTAREGRQDWRLGLDRFRTLIRAKPQGCCKAYLNSHFSEDGIAATAVQDLEQDGFGLSALSLNRPAGRGTYALPRTLVLFAPIRRCSPSP